MDYMYFLRLGICGNFPDISRFMEFTVLMRLRIKNVSYVYQTMKL